MYMKMLQTMLGSIEGYRIFIAPAADQAPPGSNAVQPAAAEYFYLRISGNINRQRGRRPARK
jgi:hypothetical protein